MTKKNSKNSQQAIGVFDSGLGGLTVLKYLLKWLPNEQFIYLGDLENLPYGNKSKEKIINYSIKCAQFLESKNVKAIIIACNTASSYAANKLKTISKIPIFDVISPCINQIIDSQTNKIAILGTEKTIESKIYYNTIKKSNKNIKIYNKACPLFVPIVEEGLEGTKISQSIVNYYLKEIKSKKIQKLILGCTHYPILIKDLENYFDYKIEILHSGPIIGKMMTNLFKENNKKEQTISYYVTDLPDRFQKLGNKFLNHNIEKVELIKLS